MNKDMTFTKMLQKKFGSYWVANFLDELLYKIDQEKMHPLYRLDFTTIVNYLNIAYKLTRISPSAKDINENVFNTGLIVKDEKGRDKELCFKLTTHTHKTNTYIETFDSNGYLEELGGENSPREGINPDDMKFESCRNLKIKNSLNNWDEKYIKVGIQTRQKTLKEYGVSFEANATIDIDTDDIKRNRMYNWLHILIDGCDNLPLSLLQCLIGTNVYFKNESKLLRQYALLIHPYEMGKNDSWRKLLQDLNYNDKNIAQMKKYFDEIAQMKESTLEKISYERVSNLKKIIIRQIEYSFDLFEKKVIDVLPSYYIKETKTQYMLPLYLLHQPKPDAVLLFDYTEEKGFQFYTLLNMKEARMNYGFFRYLCHKDVEFNDDWIKLDK